MSKHLTQMNGNDGGMPHALDAWRETPAGQIERFLAMRECLALLKRNVYTPINSLDIRLNEIITTRSMQNIGRRLSEVVNSDGTTERFVLMRAPDYRTGAGRARGRARQPADAAHPAGLRLRQNAVLRAPRPIGTHQQMRQALLKLKDGRELLATVPSEVGFECAGWDLLTSMRDVYEVCERDGVRARDAHAHTHTSSAPHRRAADCACAHGARRTCPTTPSSPSSCCSTSTAGRAAWA